MTTVILAIICAVLLLVALAGVFIPNLPGVPLAWLGLFIYAIGTDFQRISVTTIVVFFVLAALIMAIDFLAPALGARMYRASKYGFLGAFLGLIAGIVFLNVWGIIIGPFVGALALELLAKRRIRGAFRAATGTFAGFLAGTLTKTVFILIMTGFFIASWF